MTRSKPSFDVTIFLAKIGKGGKIVRIRKKQQIYVQGERCNSLFYIQKGKVRLTVVSKAGKRATIAILNASDFFGEGALAGETRRIGSAEAMEDCVLMRIEKGAMLLALHRENKLSEMFMGYLLGRNLRYEADLVDRLFNSSEKRLEHTLAFGAVRQGRYPRKSHSENQSGNGRNSGHDALAREFLHEPFQKVGVY
jgi:CRP/FNR family cyclic AMP-dependent transcriptional regulator